MSAPVAGSFGRPCFGRRTRQTAAAKPAIRRCGMYLHACWNYKYPFGLRSWQLADYHNMFLLLKEFGFNTVMFWPALEEVPAPLSEADREAVRAFRSIIEDAQKCGLEAG